MRYDIDGMRTTLDLDKDLVAEAKRLARERGISLGQCISDLARKSLAAEAPLNSRNGLMLLPCVPGTPRRDMDLVNALRDEE